MTLLLYPVLACALYYLGFWALVTKPLWSRYPAGVERFMACAACSGFWYGAGLALLGGRVCGWDYASLSWRHPAAPIISGLVALVTTPLLAVLHLRALTLLGAAATPEGEPDAETPGQS